MYIIKLVTAAAFALSVAGCAELGIDTDAERGVAGALGGAVVADAIGGNPVAGAIIGGAAGVFCDELNIPGCVLR